MRRLKEWWLEQQNAYLLHLENNKATTENIKANVNNQKMRERVNKLLAVADDDNNDNHAECKTAKQKAVELMLKHKLRL